MSGLSLWAMAVLLWSTRNCVRGRISSSGFQSSSGSRWIFSKRLAGFSGAPRWAEVNCSACTNPSYHRAQGLLRRRFYGKFEKAALMDGDGKVQRFRPANIGQLENITIVVIVRSPGGWKFVPGFVRHFDQRHAISIGKGWINADTKSSGFLAHAHILVQLQCGIDFQMDAL